MKSNVVSNIANSTYITHGFIIVSTEAVGTLDYAFIFYYYILMLILIGLNNYNFIALNLYYIERLKAHQSHPVCKAKNEPNSQRISN